MWKWTYLDLPRNFNIIFFPILFRGLYWTHFLNWVESNFGLLLLLFKIPSLRIIYGLRNPIQFQILNITLLVHFIFTGVQTSSACLFSDTFIFSWLKKIYILSSSPLSHLIIYLHHLLSYCGIRFGLIFSCQRDW